MGKENDELIDKLRDSERNRRKALLGTKNADHDRHKAILGTKNAAKKTEYHKSRVEEVLLQKNNSTHQATNKIALLESQLLNEKNQTIAILKNNKQM